MKQKLALQKDQRNGQTSGYFWLHPVSFGVLRFIMVHFKVFSNVPWTHWLFRHKFSIFPFVIDF